MKNLNYFSKFGPYSKELAGFGRFLIFHAQRGTLPRDGVHGTFDNFLREWFQAHPKTARAWIVGTPLEERNVWRSLGFVIRELWAPVPIEFTNNVQLYSLNGSGEVLRWYEIVMYISVAKEWIQRLQTLKELEQF